MCDGRRSWLSQTSDSGQSIRWAIGLGMAVAVAVPSMSSCRRLAAAPAITEDVRGESYPSGSRRSSRSNGDAPVGAGKTGEACKHLRKNQPANIPLPRTKAWFESLPPNVHPSALLRQFPRIANLIAAVWANSEFFHTYMESLLNDRRGNRRGFPPDVLDDLVSLDRHYDALNGNKRPWTDAGQRA